MENATTIQEVSKRSREPTTQKDKVFPEREIISKEDSRSKIDLEEIQKSADEEPIVNTDTQQEVVTPVEPDDISLPIRRTSSRVSKPPRFYYGFHIEEDKISDSTLSELNEPANYKEEMASPEATKWKETMKSESQSMYDNQVWNLVETTPGLKTVGCKWIFKKKPDMDGKVYTYKARLVAKGYTQTYGIDYEDTFSPVAKIKSIRIMLAISAFHDYEMWHMDVKTTFLNGKLIEDVFMAQPKDDSRSQSGWVLLLNGELVTWKSQSILKENIILLEEGHMIVKDIRSEDNPADPFTKALAKSRHDEHARSIGLKDNIKF
ncbi:retrotransposon protein, putative, ty1-copia subclass [Tanacetum coccineum]